MSQYDAELYQKFVGNVATEVCLSANTDKHAALAMRSCIARIISVEIPGFASSKIWILISYLLQSAIKDSFDARKSASPFLKPTPCK
jgi:hypothetical protein